MKKLLAAVAFSLLLAAPAAAQQAAQPCTRSGSEPLDTTRCELAIAGQTVSQQSAALVQLSARNAMLTNDLSAAQEQIKKLQEENERLKDAASKK